MGGGLRELVWGWDGDGWKKELVITLHRQREREKLGASRVGWGSRRITSGITHP